MVSWVIWSYYSVLAHLMPLAAPQGLGVALIAGSWLFSLFVRVFSACHIPWVLRVNPIRSLLLFQSLFYHSWYILAARVVFRETIINTKTFPFLGVPDISNVDLYHSPFRNAWILVDLIYLNELGSLFFVTLLWRNASVSIGVLVLGCQPLPQGLCIFLPQTFSLLWKPVTQYYRNNKPSHSGWQNPSY